LHKESDRRQLHDKVRGTARTAPSDFLLTFRMTPKEPFPITSKHSNWSSQAVVDADAIVQRAMVELTKNMT
jgi:hypothetical protein